MNIVLLLSGIVDPKWPVPGSPDAATLPRRLSPFDESALECALKLRDADPAVSISARLVAPHVEESLLRTIAAYRLDGVAGVQISTAALWDVRSLVRVLVSVLHKDGGANLVLMGREFGDCDDGLLAPCLAEALRCAFVNLAQAFSLEDGVPVALRERGELEERIALTGTALASVTNDSRNRLRHPLMKNVAVARRQRFDVTAVATAEQARPVRLLSLAQKPIERPGGECRMLTGTNAEKAEALALLLRSTQ